MNTMIAAVFIEFASYRWVFFFTTIVGIPASIVCLLLVPRDEGQGQEETVSFKARLQKMKKLDLVGVTLLTGASLTLVWSRRGISV